MIPHPIQQPWVARLEEIHHRLGDPFGGYFDDNPEWRPEEDGLLDSTAVRRWMKVVGWGARSDLYTFQQALEGKSGPRVRLNGEEILMLSTYDYLGLIGHPTVEEAAIDAIRMFGTGSGGVRLLTGTTALHRALEDELAAFKGTDAALTFTSGYLANLGIITSLLGSDDKVILDERAHRSITDACKLAQVMVMRFQHNDMESLESALKKSPHGRRTLIVVEGVYSMDGDICPLPELLYLKEKHGAFLMVDEAHSFGVLGATGRGVNEHFQLPPEAVDIWMGSLSKAIPSNGGFVTGRRDLIIYLQHGAGAFMFSAALCPPAVAAARASLRVLQEEPSRLGHLHGNATLLREALTQLGFQTGRSSSPVIPVIVGPDEEAYRLSRMLFAEGILVNAVVSPAVPRRSARLRLCATAAQDGDFLDHTIAAFNRISRNGHAQH